MYSKQAGWFHLRKVWIMQNEIVNCEMFVKDRLEVQQPFGLYIIFKLTLV